MGSAHFLPWLLATSLALSNVHASTPRGIYADDEVLDKHRDLPDFVIGPLTASVSNPSVGQSFTVTATLQNLGSAATGDGLTLHWYLDPLNRPPLVTTTTNYTDSIPAELVSNSFTFGHPVSFVSEGGHVLYFWVDRDNVFAESNESNNVYSYTVQVGNYAPDPFEGDSACAQARAISAQPQAHTLSGADEDWLTFNAVANTTYRISTTLNSGGQLSVQAFGNCQSQPISALNTYSNTWTYLAATNGPHFVRVAGNNARYGVSISQANGCVSLWEYNDGDAIATPLEPNNQPQLHNFCNEADRDTVRFPVVAGSTYVITATNIGADAHVVLDQPHLCREQLVFGEEAASGPVVTYTAEANGLACLRATNNPRTLFGVPTTYTLQVGFANRCAADSSEIPVPNHPVYTGRDDTLAQARRVEPGQPPIGHTICPAEDNGEDEDWVRFDAVANQRYVIETLNLGDKADSFICLYGPTGVGQIGQLECDEDGGAGKGSRLSWQASSTGEYFVRVRDENPDAAGPDTRYDLRILTTGCAPEADVFEPDNTREQARVLGANGATQRHLFCNTAGNAEADVDWVQFRVSPGPHIITATSLAPESDPIIELFGSSGEFIAKNDDYSSGASARIAFTAAQPITYYAHIRHFNPTQTGAGTDYDLALASGVVEPKLQQPESNPPVDDGPINTSPAQTVILVNRVRIEARFGSSESAALMAKLESLRQHPNVVGDVLDLSQHRSLVAAYAAWDASPLDMTLANATTTVIRDVLLTYLSQHPNLRFVVLVGDDALLPMRRIVDSSDCKGLVQGVPCQEREYGKVPTTHPTGAALNQNYYLSDDFYGSPSMTLSPDDSKKHTDELVLPTLAIGRLIETPADIRQQIDAFLTRPVTSLTKILVTGYDYAWDAGQRICAEWQRDYPNNPNVLDCQLVTSPAITPTWAGPELLAKHINPHYTVQSINGHAEHDVEGTPGGNGLSASQLDAPQADLRGHLIYNLGCHSGLNVPGALDLPQVFTRKGAIYVGITGFAWGTDNGVAYSERLMGIFTKQLRRGQEASMGEALANAKRLYFRRTVGLTALDYKVLQSAALYGLPMQRLQTNAALDDDAPDFPSIVRAQMPPSLPSFGSAVTQLSQTLSLTRSLTPIDLPSGRAFGVDDSFSAEAGQAAQPAFGLDAPRGPGNSTARGVLFWGGHFSVTRSFDPVIVTPRNEYVTQTGELPIDRVPGWHPAIPIGLNTGDVTPTLTGQLGQYDAALREERLYDRITVRYMFGASGTPTDTTPPRIVLVDGLRSLTGTMTGTVSVKVGAVDGSGILSTVVTYSDDAGQPTGQWQSLDLHFDPATQKWLGTFTGSAAVRYFVQVVDGAGNTTRETNKGLYFAPPTVGSRVFLPWVARGVP